MANFSVEESFLFQCHGLTECLVNLGQLEIQKDRIFTENSYKIYGQTARLIAEGGGNIFQSQGVIVSVFSMFLILPYEWKRRNVGSFGKIDFGQAELVANKTANVKIDT